MPEPRKRPRRPAPKKLVPAHPDLLAGLERLGLPTEYVAGGQDLQQHPMYHEVLAELLAKKVPA